MSNLLLTRDQFREAVLTRDKHTCVNCGAPGVDAHHLLERKLFPDGGYYLNNGATLCSTCHLLAEDTSLSVEVLRERCGIDSPALPPHFIVGEATDKWGNPILANGTRLRGELFEDDNVQKILAPILYQFVNRVKYPRTFHFPWSPGLQNDDRVLESTNQWEGMEIVVTEKMDGENTTMYRDYLHARSLEFEAHPSRTFIKAIHGQVAHDIPEGWRVCGENLTAKHSIKYTALPSYFMVFSIWNDHNICLSWDDTVEYAGALDLHTVPLLYRGVYNELKLRELGLRINLESSDKEGYVVRPAAAFPFREFKNMVGKYVRAKHVQTDEHWMRSQIEFNGVVR